MESASVVLFFVIIVAALSLFYTPLRHLIADLLFTISCGFNSFGQLFHVMSHDVRNFDPKPKEEAKIENAT